MEPYLCLLLSLKWELNLCMTRLKNSPYSDNVPIADSNILTELELEPEPELELIFQTLELEYLFEHWKVVRNHAYGRNQTQIYNVRTQFSKFLTKIQDNLN